MNINAINASKLEVIKLIIDRQADEEIAALTAQLREKSSARGKAHAEFAVREALAQIRAEEEAAAGKYKKEISRCDFETTKAVRIHRKELIEDFFEEIRTELCNFVQSDKYADYLKQSINKAKDALGSDCVILASLSDVDKVKELTDNEVRPDNGITLGGICALNEKKGLFADLSLDRALESEKSSFPETATL